MLNLGSVSYRTRLSGFFLLPVRCLISKVYFIEALYAYSR
jgi:hypothetical protein